MKIIFVCIGNFQEYLIDNIINLNLFGNNNITVITENNFFKYFNNLNVELIDKTSLDDCNFNNLSHLDKSFRNGFWHLCSLRLFYVYSYIKKNNIINSIHLENDVITYVNFDTILSKFIHQKVYATFDCDHRVIPGLIFIPNHEAFKPIIDNYNHGINDMENLAKFDESIIEPLPIIAPLNGFNNKLNKNFIDFNFIFDAAAIGQYLGGIDKRNQPGDTRGFVNETCIVKYNLYKFFWIKENDLYVPYISINRNLIRIINLHIHCKEVKRFLADNPLEDLLIKKL